MSIIEKAANRMGQERAAAPVPVPPVALSTPALAPAPEIEAALATPAGADAVLVVAHGASADAAAAAPAAAAPAPAAPAAAAPAAAAPAAAAPASALAPAPAPAEAQPAAAASDAAAVAAEATGAQRADAAVVASAADTRAAPRDVELDLARMHRIGLVTAQGGRTALVEDLRIIKRPLIKTAFDKRSKYQNPPNLIMITSSLPGEGKTYCSINLAMSIAMELDHTVLLVDADVARPSVLRTLGLPQHRGLMDLLLDEELDMADVLLRTNVPQLTILPAGTANTRATELLASQAMNAMVLEIANRYPDRIIIFDSPPLLLTSEAHVVASHMGQIVVVVEAEKTTQHALKESLRQLEGCSNINLIYNKSRRTHGIESYDYHYG